MFKDALNATTKYVATRDPDAELPWPNTTKLTGDVAAEVTALRERNGGNLVVMGSGELVRSLLPHDLVDELLLCVHPVVLGSGVRLFGHDPEPRRLRLVHSRSTGTGVVISTYRRDAEVS